MHWDPCQSSNHQNVKEYICVPLPFQVGGKLLQQLQETDTPFLSSRYTLICSAHIPLLSFSLVSDLMQGLENIKNSTLSSRELTRTSHICSKEAKCPPLFLTGMKYSLGNLSISYSANPVMSYFKKQLFFKKKKRERERPTYNYVDSNWVIWLTEAIITVHNSHLLYY